MSTLGLEDMEFWWASGTDIHDFGYVLPAYQPTLPNGDLPDLVYEDLIPIQELMGWCKSHDWVNVHRSLELYSRGSQESQVLGGPLLFDFDNSDENLFAACSTTQEALRFILSEYSLDPTRDCRTFFSGRKGFHIELRPAAIQRELLQTRRGKTRMEWELIRHLRQRFGVESCTSNVLDRDDTVLDPQHNAKRVNESINAWSNKGVLRKMKMVFVPSGVFLSGMPDRLVDELINESTLA